MNTLSVDFQRSLLTTLLRTKALEEVRPILAPELWNDPDDRKIAERLLAYFDKYGSAPDATAWRTLLAECWTDDTDVDLNWSRTWESAPLDARFACDQIREFREKHNLQGAIEQAAIILGSGGDSTAVRSALSSVILRDPASENSAHRWEKGIIERLREYGSHVDVRRDRSRVPTGLNFLDSHLDGGLGPGELGVILGRPNGGKSTVLVNMGRHAILTKRRIAHYTLEMSYHSVARRYDMSITGFTKQELRTKQKTAFDYLNRVVTEIMSGGLEIKQFPTGSATTAMISAHLDRLERGENWRPDLVIVDYASLMSGTHGYDNLRQELIDIFRSLRGMAVTRNIPVWSAHQTNRAGSQTELITMSDLAECFEIAAIVDIMASFNQTPEERVAGTARMHIAKNREDAAGITEYVKVDFSKCRLLDFPGSKSR